MMPPRKFNNLCETNGRTKYQTERCWVGSSSSAISSDKVVELLDLKRTPFTQFATATGKRRGSLPYSVTLSLPRRHFHCSNQAVAQHMYHVIPGHFCKEGRRSLGINRWHK